jgi:pyridoxal kinase
MFSSGDARGFNPNRNASRFAPKVEARDTLEYSDMQPPQQILSIQSWVAFGHVGNAAAVFPLQRLGFEVAAIHTVQFSNHTGYGAWTGSVFEPSSITDLVRGIAERGALSGFHAVLSGYMGTAGTVDAVLDAVTRVRETRNSRGNRSARRESR